MLAVSLRASLLYDLLAIALSANMAPMGILGRVGETGVETRQKKI